MDILKKGLIAVLLITSSILYAQDLDKLQEAFKQSYELEYSGEYSKDDHA